MNKCVYKTKKGRGIVETLYKKVLADYSFLTFEQLFIQTEVARTHVLRFGEPSKIPLIMIHGSMSNSAVWFGHVSEFIDHFCVYCIDIPGEPGLSEPVRIPLASEAPNRWLYSLLEILAIEKASFLTMSLGSWYALNFAISYPNKNNALSMITIGGGLMPMKISFIIKVLFSMMLGEVGKKWLYKRVFHKTEVPSDVSEFQSIVSKHFNPLIESLPLFQNEQLKKITAPIQYVGGDHDVIFDSVKTGARLKNLFPKSEIHILKDRGHVIIDQFDTIKNFLITNY